MQVCVIGAGLMGRAISYDLLQNTTVDSIIIIDGNKEALNQTKKLCDSNRLKTKKIDINNTNKFREICSDAEIMISAVPYFFNENLTKIAIKTNTHFIDLGGNNDVVAKQKRHHDKAIENQVTIIPDSGLAPGLVSIITKDIVDTYHHLDFVKIRVGGLPVQPKPPLNYEIVFSPNGLINEYLEDAYVLDHGKMIIKHSLTEIETISFPSPFETMEAFITSGGCSTLPETYRKKISYLDYKTIRYPGHCEKIKTLFDLGFGSLHPICINGKHIVPRDVFIHQLLHYLPKTEDDVVLLKVLAQTTKDEGIMNIDYTMIDYKDKNSGLTAMMRTTGFPVSITADFLLRSVIEKPGVFTPEEIIDPSLMFKELEKRKIHINKTKIRN